MRPASIAKLFGAGLLFACGAASPGKAASTINLLDDVEGHPRTSYLDLAKLVVPDLAPAEDGTVKGSAPSGIRDIAGKDQESEPPEVSSISSAAVLDIRAGGKERVLMLFDLGQSEFSAAGFAVLALYDLSGQPRLLDAANVASDRFTSFNDTKSLSIGPGDDAVMTMSSHFNSSQTYMSTDLILVRNDRLRLVDSIFTFDERLCEFTRTQALEAKAGRSRKPYADIVATVTDAIEPGESGCEQPPPKASSHRVTVTYRWNKARGHYVPSSNAFEKLAEDNAKRF